MIIELFGMPGSGKTTISNYFERKIGKKSILKNHADNFWGRIIFRIFSKVFKINKDLRQKYNDILEIIGDKKKYENIIDESIDITIYVKCIIFSYYLEGKLKKEIILEEGIVHYCIALYAEFNVDFDKLESIINKVHINEKKVKCIGIKSIIKDVLNNIKKRNRKQCALDYLGESELVEVLERYNEGIKHFSKKYEVLEIKEIKARIDKF